MPKKFTLLNRETLFQGYFRVDRYRIRHEQFAGGWSPPFTREVFDRSRGVAAILLFDPQQDKVVLVEQFRAGPLMRGEDPWMLEIVMGMIDADETPEQAAKREALEEAGCTVTDLQPVAEFFTSPGGTSEHITLFAGRTAAPADGSLHGMANEDEDIRVTVMDATRAIGLLYTNKIRDSQTLAAIQWFAMHHTELRSRWLVSEASPPII